MVKKLAIILFFTLSGLAAAQELEVKASVDSAEYYVGDYINFTIKATHPENSEIVIPEFKDTLKALEFIKELPTVKKDGPEGITETRKYVFSKYDSAEVMIAPIRVGSVTGGDTAWAYTEPVVFVVRTMDVNPQSEIMDVKAPVKVPFDWLFAGLIALGVLLVLLAAFAVYIYFRKKRKAGEEEKVVIVIPPDTKALKALHEIEDSKLWQQGKIKEYHSEVTFVIRRYFEERFNFPALEMTSGEIEAKISTMPKARKVLDITSSFFGNADMVKFAKFEPMPSVNEEMMKQAYKIVNDTRPKEETVTEGEKQHV